MVSSPYWAIQWQKAFAKPFHGSGHLVHTIGAGKYYLMVDASDTLAKRSVDYNVIFCILCVIIGCYDSTPIFPLFSLTWLHVPLVSHATYPVHPACASKSRDLFLLTLHSRALSYSPMPLFGSLQLCRGSLSHSSDSFIYDSLIPFSTIHLPHSVCFLIPVYVTDISHFTFIRGPMLLSLIQYYT